MAGFYTLHDLRSTDPITGEPFYSLEDVLDHNEMLAVKAENERRATEEAGRRNHRGR